MAQLILLWLKMKKKEKNYGLQDEMQVQQLWFMEQKLNEDISVPRSKLPEALDEIYKIGEKYGFQVPCFGHAGDGNIHVNVMVKDKTNEKKRWLMVTKLLKRFSN